MNTNHDEKGWWRCLQGRAVSSTARSLHIEHLVETGKPEDVIDVAVDVDQPQPRSGGDQSLVSPQEDTETGAGDVFESAEVERLRRAGRIDESLGLGA
jgi:hypothetical protein